MESQSIFDNENTRLSLFDADAISGVAPSELDFDFDGLVLNSQAYRRVFAQAQSDANLKSQIPVTEAFSLHFSDGATLQRDCGETIRSKFFPPKDNPHAQICERDYFRRLGLLCHLCGQGLDRTYIMSGNKKYHVRHLRSELPLASYDAEDVSPEGQFPDDMENDVQVYDYNRIGYFMEIVWAYYEGLAFLCLVMSPKEAISHNSKPDGLQQDTVTSADIETAC
ncbi:hypothetical protein BHE90_012887 [Fusarium euwallaceae]|uniref:Uncharacterized protein n=1 Tax=Fusarium euwallaceae TaxID=1147111 RepID=A0A430LAC6_9HYPO|nr:hypothetical protein BHE90_012887 [Fusarium euwallaceae]